jgi:hypothetical protein
MAEWLRRGLQILARRFDSGSGLHTFSVSFNDRARHGFWPDRTAGYTLRL